MEVPDRILNSTGRASWLQRIPVRPLDLGTAVPVLLATTRDLAGEEIDSFPGPYEAEGEHRPPEKL